MRKHQQSSRVIALAGNPNVGKSTVFNGLTGLRQHTGNWTGKTVDTAWGVCKRTELPLCLVDLPGTYSLLSHSPEEEVARDFLCFGGADGVIALCDATCLGRSLNLVLQILELTPHVILCVNLMDEAAKTGIRVSTEVLSDLLGVNVVGISARSAKDLSHLAEACERTCAEPPTPTATEYPAPIEDGIRLISEALASVNCQGLPRRWLALRLLEGS